MGMGPEPAFGAASGVGVSAVFRPDGMAVPNCARGAATALVPGGAVAIFARFRRGP